MEKLWSESKKVIVLAMDAITLEKKNNFIPDNILIQFPILL